MKKALHFFVKKLRLSNPWKFKAPLLITFPYLIFLLSYYKCIESFPAILASVTIIIGVAGLGYLTNDLGDRKKDHIIQKDNATSSLSLVEIVLLFLLFFGFAITPWLYLPFNKTSLLLLGLQFFLFYIYAFKPFRLKERGLLGVLADALYAHVVPAILATFTFFLLVQKLMVDYLIFLLLLSIWQFLLGLRNICLHQLKDFENDKTTQTRTFVVQVGNSWVNHLIKKVILPLEIIAFIVFVIFISCIFPGFAFLIILYWLYKFYIEKNRLITFGYHDFSNKFLDDLYTQWLPFVVLLLLCCRSFNFLPLLLFHFLIFRSEFKTRILYYLKPTS